MTIQRIVLSIALVLAGLSEAQAGNLHALVINGLNKDPADKLSKDHTLESLRQYLLTTTKVHPNRLTVLDAGDAKAPPTRDNIRAATNALASAVGPQDRLLFYYMGQANAIMGTLRLNLPGDDVTHEEIADWLSPIAARTQLIVLDCPCAALAVKALTGPGRIIVCATAETQVYSTRFGHHFVQALAQGESETDVTEKVSVLTAFTTAAREIEQWYRQREVLPTETPCLEDNGDGIPSTQPWRYTVEAVDGRVASTFFLAEN